MAIYKWVATLIEKYSFMNSVERNGLYWDFCYNDENNKEQLLKIHMRRNKTFIVNKLNEIKKQLNLPLIGE